MAKKTDEFSTASKDLLTIDQLDEVYRACYDCAAKWRPFGLRLGLSQALLDQIEDDEKRASPCLQRVLAGWLKRNYIVSPTHPDPSWWALCIAVAEGGRNRELAIQICADHPSSAQGSVIAYYYSDEDLKKMCVCGECSINKVITDGCPSESKKFHQLDVKRLTLEHREIYMCKTLEEIRDVKEEFSILYENISESLKHVSVTKLKMFIKTFQWFNETTNEDLHKNLQECQDSENVFVVVADVCSWFNHDTLGRLVNRYGTEELKSQYHRYVDVTLMNFLKRNITEFTNYGLRNTSGSQQFRLKLETEPAHHQIAGTILPLLKRSVAKCLEIPMESLHIISFEKGCLEVTFSLPAGVYNELFPLSLHHSQALETLVVRDTLTELRFKAMFYEGKDNAAKISVSQAQAASTLTQDTHAFTESDEENKRELKILVVGPPEADKKTVVQSLLKSTKPQIETLGSLDIYTGQFGDITMKIFLYDTKHSASDREESLKEKTDMHGNKIDIVIVCNSIFNEPTNESIRFVQQEFDAYIWKRCILVLTQESTEEDKTESDKTVLMKKHNTELTKFLKKKGVPEDIAFEIPVFVTGDLKDENPEDENPEDNENHQKGSNQLLEVCLSRYTPKSRIAIMGTERMRDSSKRYGFMAGAILGGIIGTIIPVPGIPLGIVIGGLLGQYQGEKSSKRMELSLKKKKN